ncbi:sigma-70 family RNA polymerase sigma factor [Virgisporangium aurantiacum]|uniref:RNA polymerase sigma factor n=1 Tax=Virgisporangium aurantiacum TaxID=175570 RepID=A0A8J4DZW3_9ACTN|nr:sigma-70 family RNA polymerase sigma factor [Virgisporangium aurantiacum]GIJ56111.1 RNA polymerase sigma factor [Virgisporangium aurantiacum]
MEQKNFPADVFEAHRPRLTAVAQRMLGSRSDADDAVQEAWLRANRAGADEVDNLAGWLTTIVARVCLTMLRSRTSRREEPLPERDPAGDESPEHQAVEADAVGVALLVVLDTLTPAERLAFVLHDMFGVPFEEIAPIVDRTPAAARQLASRARRRVRGVPTDQPADPGRVRGVPTDRPAEPQQRRDVVRAFLAASREGDFAGLLAVLAPDVVVRADAVAVAAGSSAEVRGAQAVAQNFLGRARAAVEALVDGAPGAAWLVDGTVRVVFEFTFDGAAITAIDLRMDPAAIAAIEVDA